ncbi:MAG: chemotaxis protein CheX [Burkholderiaceae bacterium]|jgi:chemotaxis protein CheX|nr:chemotaxis protein CheX [Burkholderiaceae bacterium]
MADITEQEICVFAEAVGHYFNQMTGEQAKIETSFLAEGRTGLPAYDFTGQITVGGQYQGYIYFSAPRIMLTRLLLEMKELQQTDAQWLDAVGEIANTLSGNARKHFGETMEISTPMAVRGAPKQFAAPVRKRPYVILFKWKNYDAAVIVDIVRN